MRDLVTVYVEVETNKIMAEGCGMSFDFQNDVWSKQSAAPRFDYTGV
jgi:hypothetical protein